MLENSHTTVGDEAVEMHLPNHKSEHSIHRGAILGILLIALVLILGGLFLWGSMLDSQLPQPVGPTVQNNEPETPRAIADQQIIETVSPSDDLSMIEADIGATNLDSLDSELNTIDSELQTALP